MLTALADELRIDVSALLCELCAALLGSLGGLLQLHQFELEVVAAALLRRQREALGVPFLLALLELSLDGVERRTRHAGRLARGADGTGKLVELALALEDTVYFAVGLEQRDALRCHEVPCRRREGLAHGERATVGERLGQRAAAAHPVQCVRDEPRATSGRLTRTFASSASPPASAP